MSLAEEQTYEFPVDPNHIAWGIILIFFATFCVVFLASVIGIYSFLFESTVSAQSVLRVGRGTIGITDTDLIPRVVRNSEDLTGRTAIISTDSQSQTTISYRVPDETNRLIAAVTLKQDTSANFRRATIPRFDWSSSRIEIDIRDLEGEIDILVTGESDRGFLLNLETVSGHLVYFTRKGRYLVTSTEEQVTVVTREGEAIIFQQDLREGHVITAAQSATAMQEDDEIFVTPTRDNIIENGLFVLSDTSIAEEDETPLPARWGCTNIQDNTPRGDYRMQFGDGRSSIRLVRAEGASSHGETRCKQFFPEPGYSLEGYSYLELTTTFFINFQSLSDCGVAGSECPLRILLEYEDINGNDVKWDQGFYYLDDLQLDYPLRCSGCTQDNQKINEKVWYTFETGNLFASLPADQRPAYIKSIELYASGHQYDVYISEIALFVGLTDIVSPDTLDVSEEVTELP